MIRTYQYRCNDHSLLTPTFKKWIVAPLLRFVPWAIPANVVTIISNGFVYGGLYFSLHPTVFGNLTPLVIGLCLFLYLVGDHLDGMQAKRTGTGSALGEFCDHYLDAFNNGLIVYTVFMVFGVQNLYLITLVMVCSYLGHMTVFYEQFKTGWLTFEKLGSLEGVLISALLVASASLAPVTTFMSYPVFGSFRLIEVIMLLTGVGGLLTFINITKRTPEIKSGFWLFVVLLILVSIESAVMFTSMQVFAVITLYASLYIGRIMRGHLIDGVERHTDLIGPVYLGIASMLQVDVNFSFWILVIYLSACIGLLVYQTFAPLKTYWVWVNAKP